MEFIMSGHGSQFELFPFMHGRPVAIARPRYLSKDLTLSVENTIVLGIIFIMAVVLFFSFGVERGKRVVRGLTQSSAVGSRETLERSAPALDVKTPKAEVAEKAVPAQALPPKPAKPDVQSSPQKKGTGVFTVQVASFKDRELAQREANVLKKKGYRIFVLPKGSHSIVCVGKFAVKDEATEFSNNLKNHYNDCLVRRL